MPTSTEAFSATAWTLMAVETALDSSDRRAAERAVSDGRIWTPQECSGAEDGEFGDLDRSIGSFIV